MREIIEQSLKDSLSYVAYRKLISDLLSEGKSTGMLQNEDMRHYSELNEARMHRLDKTIEVLPEIAMALNKLPSKYIWLVLSEGWCGDAANIVPVLNKMAEISAHIELKIVLRDDHDALMQHFLTNGGKAIPKLIILDAETHEVLGDWGPRPEEAKQLILDYKASHGVVDEPAKIALQKWYVQNKGVAIQNEVMNLHEYKAIL